MEIGSGVRRGRGVMEEREMSIADENIGQEHSGGRTLRRMMLSSRDGM